MRRVLSMLAVCMAVSTVAVAQPATPAAVTEPRSGISFPVSLTPPGGTMPHWLMGTALRDRTIFRVPVYAFGLYVEPDAARATLAPFAGASRSTLERDARFFQSLLRLELALTLRLVMTRTVDGDDMATAFDEALRPRVARLGRQATIDTQGTALERFRALFDVDDISAGTEIVLSCGPAGRLATSVGGDERTSIDSVVLCRALFDVYLGENPISDEGKRRIIAGFSAMLR